MSMSTPDSVEFESREEIKNILEKVWTAESFREYQKSSIIDIVEALFIEDYDGAVLSCPTGGGKSLMLYAVSRIISHKNGYKTFSTTPLNTLIDQIEKDDLIEQAVTLKGKNNYSCVHPMDAGTNVDDAVCQRMTGFNCEYKDEYPDEGGCPYYGRKELGKVSDTLVTNLSYLMTNAMIPSEYGFEPRTLLEIDEVQNVEDFALQFIGFTIDESRIPVDFSKIQPIPGEHSSMDKMVRWLNTLLSLLINKTNRLSSQQSLTDRENKELKKLKRIKHRVINFIEDQEKGKHWTKTHDENNPEKVSFEPVFIGRFIDKFLWSQAEKYILSSATIPKGEFLEEIGLEPDNIKRIEVPSTFPVGNRPVITDYVGKMTKNERRETIPKMVDKIEELAEHHRGERGFIHCNSYGIMERIYDRLGPEVKHRTMKQDPDNREESLDKWIRSDKQIFLSVAQDEGISLDGDKARWQVVAKASYPFVGDERVSYRLNELGDWDWYNNCAIINLQQAAGRAVRSKDDEAVTYLLDSSFKSLLNRNRHLFEGWFLEAVNCETHLDVMRPESKFNLSA
jgi:Rad3-related DNA helicase